MRRIAPMGIALLCASGLVSPALAAGEGGTGLPESGGSGGLEYGVPLAARPLPRPEATQFSVTPTTVTEGGRTPALALRIDQAGGRTVTARVVFLPLRGNGRILRLELGKVATGRVVHPRWPGSATLTAGRYQVQLHAKDATGRTLRRRAHSSGRTTLIVKPAAKPVTPVPLAQPTSPVTPGGGSAAGVVPGGMFPVGGPHSFGDTFGAKRPGYSHQGQDVLAAEGTPIVAPVAGTISFTDYQASAAGYYVVEHAADGRDFFFAHCQKGSVAVSAGQAVAQGAPLCNVGHTGDASGPHLHFEIWPNGWRTSKTSEPVDPLPQLQAWDGH